MIFRRLIAFFTLLAALTPAFAVTDKEMEEARTITAKAYLRYANDGSGYLDALSPKTMAELTASLKDKEKTNLKAFNSVAVPKDYASWDKDKLVEFWAVTFFKSPNLTDKGKVAKTSVRKKLQAMTIAAPAPKSAPQPEAPAEQPTAAAAGAAANPLPADSAAKTAQEDILADQKAIEEDLAEASNIRKEESHTWVYVVVLIILVGVVIWLVVIAANMMKRSAPEEESSADADAVREKARAALAKKNGELAAMQNRAADAEATASGLEKALAALREENEQLSKRCDDLSRQLARAEAARADAARIEATRAEAARAEAARAEAARQEAARAEAARQEAARAEVARQEAARQAAQAQRSATQPATAAAQPAQKRTVIRQESPAREKAPILHDIYLGRANAKGQFVRADRALTPGHSIFRLHTDDGMVGSFTLVDDPSTLAMALEQPIHYLAGGCTGADLNDTSDVEAVETLSPGTAIFENGCWRVLRKTTIRFE